jgi:four helix bundle protein
MNILREKSYTFALKIVQMYKEIVEQKKEFVLSKQVLRSGTSIGAMVRESEYAQSKADFVNKLSIAIKEANETDYWLNLLLDSKYITQQQYDELSPLCIELIKIATSSINTAKRSNQ